MSEIEAHAPAVRAVTVAAAGVDGLVIVATPDAVLVCRRDDPDAVRRLTDELARRGRSDLL